MYLQQPNTYAGRTRIVVQQDFQLASELFLDDLFLIKKRERQRISFVVSAMLILSVTLPAGIVIWRYLSSGIRSSSSSRVVSTSTTVSPATAASDEKSAVPPAAVTGHTPLSQDISSESPQSRSKAIPAKKREQPPENKRTRTTAAATSPKRPIHRSGTVTSSVQKSTRTSRTTSTSSSAKKQKRTTIRHAQKKAPTFSPSGAVNEFDRSAFYVPADTKGSGSRRKTAGRSSSGKTGNADQALTMVNNKVYLVANLAQLHGGQLKQTLEHNGDYYKLKLLIPVKQLLPFKKDLAKMVEYASYTNVPEESLPEKSCLILETHFR